MSANKRKIKNLYRYLKGDLKNVETISRSHRCRTYSKRGKNFQRYLFAGYGAGKVLDNGTRVAPEVKVGDEVVFAKYSGTEFKYDGKDYLILSERDVLAVL